MKKELTGVIVTLLEKFGGTLVGSAAARFNGVAVEPKDFDVRFPEDGASLKIASMFLEARGFKKELIDVPSGYRRSGYTKWTGRMSSVDGMSIDLFSGGEILRATDGVASLTDVLRGHLKLVPEDRNEQYMKKLIEAIAQ